CCLLLHIPIPGTHTLTALLKTHTLQMQALPTNRVIQWKRLLYYLRARADWRDPIQDDDDCRGRYSPSLGIG
ncbi:Hypothetical predicted protein, partial [Pelobates cultripes]